MATPDLIPVEEPKDLGFGSVVGGFNEKRLLNRDGSFNPRRDGLPLLRSLSFYHYFLTITWSRLSTITRCMTRPRSGLWYATMSPSW